MACVPPLPSAFSYAPAAKKRKQDTLRPRFAFVATSWPQVAAQGVCSDNLSADLHVAVVGYICVEGAERYADPAGKHLEDLSALRLG